GTPLGAEVTAPLLESLFMPAAPLHDGAVVISGTQVTHAGCMLPLSRREDLPPQFGTRHRAALGLTEETDAVCLVVSEERGEVTLMTEGTFRSGLTREETAERLHLLLGGSERRMPRRVAWGTLLLRRWPLKIGAVAVVTALWVYLGGAQKFELGLRVPVEYRNVPESLTLSGRPATSLEVRLRGTRAALGGVNRESLRATVDLVATERGTNFVAIEREDVNVPAGVEVVGTEPAVLRLTLERVRRLQVPVRARLRGEPARGYAVEVVTVVPGTVEILGPESAVANLQAVYTEAVDLTGAQASFNRAVPLALFPERLALADGQKKTVEVRVTLRRTAS
ncbi:MAG: diadenylate cyclase, partial [Candidatus Methylomirabilales bacterium]